MFMADLLCAGQTGEVRTTTYPLLHASHYRIVTAALIFRGGSWFDRDDAADGEFLAGNLPVRLNAIYSDRMRVLLVEDSKRLQSSVGRGLRKAGYALDVTGDGKEGLWLAESN